MRIAIFVGVNEKRVSGYAIAVNLLQKGIRRLKHDVAFVKPSVLSEGTDKKFDLESPGGLWVLPNIVDPTVKERLIKFKPDILHSHDPAFVGISAIQLGYEEGIPVIFTVHGDIRRFIADSLPKFWGVLFLPIVMIYLRKYLNMCDLITVPNESIKKAIRAERIYTKIAVQPMGIELSGFKVESRKYPQGKVSLLSVGSLNKIKRMKILVDMMRYLDSAKYSLTIVGEGPERARIEAHIAKYKLGNVKLVGRVQHATTQKYYKGSDMFVFGSSTEAQGLVFIEAMAAGLPIVSTENLGSKHMVRQEKSGITIRQPSAKSLAKSVIKIAETEALYISYSKNGIKNSQKYDTKNTSRRMVEIYEDTIKRFERKKGQFYEGYFDRFVKKLRSVLFPNL